MDIKAWAASKKLPPLTHAQIQWAKTHLFDAEAYWCGDEVWCGCCGHVWDKPRSSKLVDVLGEETCPHCGATLHAQRSRKQKVDESMYMTIITTCNNMQVSRTFDVRHKARKGSGCDYEVNEVVQLWLDEQGEEAIIACSRQSFSYLYDRWIYGTLSCKRRHGYIYGNPYYFIGEVYPRQRVLPIIRRNGYRKLKGMLPHSLMQALVTNAHAETLVKARQYPMLKHMVNTGWNCDWHAVRQAIKHNRIIKDVPTWVDYLRACRELGYDERNPIIALPTDIKSEHDRLLRIIARRRERERVEEMRKTISTLEPAYNKAMRGYFGIMITEGEITVRPLCSVKEFFEEGEAMHHCVFTNEYYNKDNTLILSARDKDGRRIETVEYNLKSRRVIQSRGVNNMHTKHHDRIVRLVERNSKLITNQ